MRTKILLVSRNFPPLVGGMERLNWHMAKELSKMADVCIVGPAASSSWMPAESKFFGVVLRPVFLFLAQSLWTTVKVARRWRPDIVLAGSGLTAPVALLAARLFRARAVAYVHGLDVSANNIIYKLVWLPTIRRMDALLANSRSTAGLLGKIGVPENKVSVLHPGIQFPAPNVDASEVWSFRQLYGLEEKTILLSVGRLTVRKGIRDFISHSLPAIVRGRPDVVLVVVGEEPADSVASKPETKARILQAAREVGVLEHVLMIGNVTESVLHAAYRSSAVHVFPVKSIRGDPEGFGMVAVEAASHGLPTVAFATGGIVDAVGEGRSGYLAPPHDYSGFAKLTLRAIKNNDVLRDSCRAFSESFSWSHFGTKIATLLGSDKP